MNSFLSSSLQIPAAYLMKISVSATVLTRVSIRHCRSHRKEVLFPVLPFRDMPPGRARRPRSTEGDVSALPRDPITLVLYCGHGQMDRDSLRH